MRGDAAGGGWLAYVHYTVAVGMQHVELVEAERVGAN